MHRRFVAAVLACSLTPALRAQEVPETGSALPAGIVSEAEFIAPLGEGHVAVRALADDLARAEGASARARTLVNPRLDFWREAPDDHPEVTNWTLAWTPPLDGRHGLGKKATEAGLEAARTRFEIDRAGLRTEFRRVFAEWSLAVERGRALTEQQDLVAGLAERARERARVGEESGLSARRFALARSETATALGEAEAARARAEAEALALRPDLAAGSRPVTPDLPEPPVALDPGQSARLAALEKDKVRTDYEARRVSRFVSFPTLQVGWQTLEDAGVDAGGPILAATWAVPLFDRDQGARVEADRVRDAAEARLTFARDRIAGEIEGRLAAYRTLYAAAGEAARVAGETRQVIEAATAAYQAGESSLTDLLDTLRSAFAARLRAIDARAGALAAHRDLEEALGRPLAVGGSLTDGGHLTEGGHR